MGDTANMSLIASLHISDRLRLFPRAAVDSAYLVRSRLGPWQKFRVLMAYVKLTLQAAFARSSATPRVDRFLGFSIRHFDIEALQFLFREVFVRAEYYFAAATPRPVVFDCGANIGVATLFFKWVYPEAEIHAFEPDPATFAALSENVARNRLSNVHLYNVALADSPGRLDLFVPTGSKGSVLTSMCGGRLAGLEVTRVEVQAVMLSTCIGRRPVDFLKMDVEGVEESVLSELAGADALCFVREMAVEYHHNIAQEVSRLDSFLHVLTRNGYRYQVDATWGGNTDVEQFQDVLVRARCR